jgi:hypothetical protein
MDEVQLQGINFKLAGVLVMEQVVGSIEILLIFKDLEF